MSPKSDSPAIFAQLERWGGRVSRAQYLWAFTAAAFLATAFLGSFFIQAPWQQQRRILENRHREEIQRSELLMALGGLQQRLGRLEEQILLQGGTPVLTSEVTRLAANFELEIESIAPKEEISLYAYRKLQIEIQADATFSSLLLFLHALETHQPLFLVSEVEIERPMPSSDGSAYSPVTTYPRGGPLSSLPSLEELDPERQSVRMIVAAFAREVVG